jgi:nicotinamidase-related amidase
MAVRSMRMFLAQFLASAYGAVGKSALLIVDVQDCFLEGGSLAVPAKHIIPKLNQIRNEKDCLFDVVIRSQDYHPANHISFGSTHGLAAFSHLSGKGGLPLLCEKPSSGLTSQSSCCPAQHIDPESVNCSTQLCPPSDWTWAVNNSAIVASNPACTKCMNNSNACFEQDQAMWTDHCLSTRGGDATFPSNLVVKSSDIVVQKGTNMYVDAYSAFMDNSKFLKTDLDAELQKHGVDTLYVAGIATDVCVKWTVDDALSNRTASYKISVITDASAGLATGSTPTKNHEDALEWMSKQGATLVTTADILAKECMVLTGFAPVNVSPLFVVVMSLVSLALRP